MTRTILIAEDDPAIATALSLNLRLAGMETIVASDGDIALERALTQACDLMLLDINLPKRNGLAVLEAVRQGGVNTPVIVLSARDAEFDKVAALRLGADDYVTKPFALAELLARIEAVLRRSTQPSISTQFEAQRLTFSDVEISPSDHTVRRHGELVHLTHLEYQLLSYLVSHPRQVFSRQQLFEAVWGQNAGAFRTVDNFIGQLRRHFEDDPEAPRYFVTVRGAGYRFDP